MHSRCWTGRSTSSSPNRWWVGCTMIGRPEFSQLNTLVWLIGRPDRSWLSQPMPSLMRYLMLSGTSW